MNGGFETARAPSRCDRQAIARGVRMLAIVLTGCGSSTRLPTAPDSAIASDATAPEDGAQLPAASDAAIESDATAPGDSGTYHKGANTCCGPGQGLTCCTADAGLFGYETEPDGAWVAVGDLELWAGGIHAANCFQYGGAFGACAGDGVPFDGKEPCVVCCPGLVRVDEAVPNDGGFGPIDGGLGTGACYQILGEFMCLPCGNGICEPEENHCRCPADCPD